MHLNGSKRTCPVGPKNSCQTPFKQLYYAMVHSDLSYCLNVYSCANTTALQKLRVKQKEALKVHKIEIFFGFDFEICIISLLVMWKY